MRLQAHGAGKAIPSSTATGHRFVVLTAPIAEAEIVHRSLAGRLDTKGTEQQIAKGLRHLHIAGHHSRWVTRIQQTARWHHQIEWCETALVQGDVVVEEATDHVQHGRARHRQGGIEVARPLGRCSGEIQPQPLALPIKADLHHQA